MPQLKNYFEIHFIKYYECPQLCCEMNKREKLIFFFHLQNKEKITDKSMLLLLIVESTSRFGGNVLLSLFVHHESVLCHSLSL